MKEKILKFKNFFKTSQDDFDEAEDFIEIDVDKNIPKKPKITVRPFNIGEFDDVKPAIDAVREGYTIALLNIRSLKDKDIIELKRAISKVKKTCDAIDGDIAGFGEDWIVMTPHFARVHRETNHQIENIEE